MSSGDKRKTKATLTEELGCLRLRIDELEKQEEARKQAEADLKVSEERYRLLAENATDVIFAFDNDLRLTYLSPSAQRMFGYSFEESQSIPLEKVFTPETLKKVNIISEAAKEAEPAIDKGKLKPLTIEIEVNRKDGSLIWCEVKSTFMFDNNDRVLGYTGVVRDITERKQVELDLKETMKQLQTVSDGIVDGLIIADTKKGGILSVNTAICTMLGYSETELLSMSIVDIHPRDQVNWIIKEVSKKTSGYMTNIPFLRKDGSVFFADIGARNIFFMGQSCAIGFIKDVTDRKKGEEALRESEEKFRELAELLPEIVFEIDDRGNLTFTNRHAEKITGYGLKDVEKKIKAIDILIPEDRDRGIQNILTVLRGEVPGNSEYTIQRKDGSTFAVIIRSAPVIKDGVPAGVRGIIIDISGRKAAEDALKESEKNYKALFNTSPESISLLSLDGTVLDCNKSSEELFGFTREEIIGRPFEASAAFRYEKALDLMDIRNKVLADEDVEPFETSMTKVGGQKGWVDIFPSLLKKDGKPYAIQIIARDITGRKIANAALRESEQKFRDLAELLPEMLCEVDEQGNITYINRMAFKVFGYSREDLEKGLNAMDMVVPEDLDRARKHMAKVLKGRYQGGIEFTARRKDGLTFPIVVYANPRIQANKSVGMRMIIIDNTERKKVEDELRETKEQAEAANLAMSEFLAMMSHEIRTPLNSIIGFGGLMMETELTPEQSEYSESMQHSGKILLGIINDILDFSKIEDGKLDIESEPFDLHETINEVVNLMEPGAKAHGLELHFRYAPEMPFNFIGDGGRIHQVLINLVDNAVKFTSAGHITISVERLENVNDGDEALLRLEVEDTGIGIPEEKIELIFNKFTQAESYTSRRYGGSGLGLAISKKLAELMGGTIGVASRPGKGSTFWFTVSLPVDNLAETFFDSHDKRVGKVPESDEMEGLSHVRVLIAEDNIMSQKMLTRVLEKIGCRVDPVANGKEAVNIMEKIPYDLVFMDCQMPEMDGFDATRRIREMEGSSEHTPIIAMTAHAFREDRQRCIEAGMDDYISKPIAIEKLKTALKRWVVREETIVLAGRKEKNKPSKAPVFDHEGVLKRIGGDGDLLVSCMRDFLIDTPGQIEKLQEALFSEDETAIKNQAHKMKGAAGNMGVEQFKKQLISIERAAATEDLEKAGVVFNEVIIQFQALKEIMQGLIGKDAVGPRND